MLGALYLHTCLELQCSWQSLTHEIIFRPQCSSDEAIRSLYHYVRWHGPRCDMTLGDWISYNQDTRQCPVWFILWHWLRRLGTIPVYIEGGWTVLWKSSMRVSKLYCFCSQAITCPCTSCPESAHAPPNTKPRLDSIVSTRDNSTTIALIDKAIADLELRELGEQYTLKEISKKYSVDRLTLGRQWRRVTASRDKEYSK